MDEAISARRDVGYTHGYHGELAPGLIDFATLLSGYRPPDRAGMTYLELGYGQGLAVNIHAAACRGAYYGADFIQEHVLNAQALGQASGADAQFTADSFSDLAKRDDLPSFDYIVMHGIWSWIPEADRQAVLTILRDRLKPDGVVYLGYNSQPGWAPSMPLRELMSLHAHRVSGDGGRSPASIDAAMNFARTLAGVGARYFVANPSAVERLDEAANQDRRYLAHDYFNPVWNPTYFADLAQQLATAGLNFAGPARVKQRVKALHLTAAQAVLLDGIGDPILRETAWDFMSNQGFRCDLFTRRTERLSPEEQSERLMAVKLVLTVRGDEVPLDVIAGAGPVSFDRAIYRPVILAMGADGGAPKSIGELLSRPEIALLPPGALLEALAMLVGLNHAHPVQTDEDMAIARPRCEALNQLLRQRARTSDDVRFLASPVIGAGIRVARFEQIFLSARRKGATKPEDWAREVYAALAANGESFAKNGQPLTLSAEAIPELTRIAKHFAVSRLAVLEQLEVA